jgi:hypothetical protein
MKVRSATTRTVIEVAKRIPAAEPIHYGDAHDLPTVATDARLETDPLKAEASEQFGFMAAGKTFSLEQNTHQSAPPAEPDISQVLFGAAEDSVTDVTNSAASRRSLASP